MYPYAGLRDVPRLAACAEGLYDLTLGDQPGVICIARTNESTQEESVKAEEIVLRAVLTT